MMGAFENTDFETAYCFFDDDCRFISLELPIGETLDLDQIKERNENVWKTYEFNSNVVIGYPNVLEYDLGDAKVVPS